MKNPFDVSDTTFRVVVNSEGQHSLRHSFADGPEGWSVVLGESSRVECLGHIEENWTDIRPKSLTEALRGD